MKKRMKFNIKIVEQALKDLPLNIHEAHSRLLHTRISK